MNKVLFVGGIPYKTTQEELSAFFSSCGTVVDVKLIMDRHTGRSKGFGFVEMSTEDEAKAALTTLSGKDFGGRQIFVSEARPLPEGAAPSEDGAPASAPAGSQANLPGTPGFVERRSGRDRRRGWGPFSDERRGGHREERSGGFDRKKPWERKPFGEKKEWGDKPGFRGPKKFGDRPGFGGPRKWGDKSGSDRKPGDFGGPKKWGDKSGSDRKPGDFGGPRKWGDKSGSDRKPGDFGGPRKWGDKSGSDRKPGDFGGKKSWGDKPGGFKKKWDKKPGGFGKKPFRKPGFGGKKP